jgi:peptidyl-prolyl cis-trans isomerase C
MKFRFKSFSAFVAVVMAFALFSGPVAAEKGKTTPSPVATVNGSPIPGADFDTELDQLKMRYLQQGRQLGDEEIEKFKESILGILINRELLYQESQRQGITVDENKVSEQLMSAKKRFPSEAEFKKTMEEMNLTEADIKFQITRAMAIRDLVEKDITKNINISDEETKAYYDKNPEAFKQTEEVKASHILIKVDADADASKKAMAREKIEKVQAKLKNGEDFSTLAKEYSEGPSNVKGGDLGYFKRGQMVKPFEETAFNLQPNEISGVVETQFGYHLIKIYDKKPEGTITYKDAKDKISQYLKQEKGKAEIRKYIDKLKEKAEIKSFLGA